MVVIDEIHLLNDFGRTFLTEFQLLQQVLFTKLKRSTPMLFLTVTCTDLILASFERLIGVSCNSIHWPDSKDMVNRKVSIVVLYIGQWYQYRSSSST